MKVALDSSLSFLQPLALAPSEFIRLGPNQDVGYVIPWVALEKANGLLALGVGDNWDFEEQWHILKPIDPICAYDGAINYDYWTPVHYLRYQDFFGQYATHVNRNVSKMENDCRFSDAFAQLPALPVFIKCDIEGCEYQIVDEIVEVSSNITGMAIEFNGTTGRKNFQIAVQTLLSEFSIAHLHGNNCSPLSDYNLPDTLEVTFLNKALCNTTSVRQNAYLQDLDFPNDIMSEDFILYFE